MPKSHFPFNLTSRAFFLLRAQVIQEGIKGQREKSIVPFLALLTEEKAGETCNLENRAWADHGDAKMALPFQKTMLLPDGHCTGFHTGKQFKFTRNQIVKEYTTIAA